MGYLEEENQILRDALLAAKSKLSEQDTLLHQLLMQPTMQAIVVALRGSKVLLSTSNGLVETAFPFEKVNDVDLSKGIRVGAGVRLIMEPVPAIIDLIPLGDWVGDLVLAAKEGKDGECEVDWGGNTRRIRYSDNIKVPEVGDRLMLDERAAIAIKNFGPDESAHQVATETGVSWEDIGGLADAKAALIEAVEMPHRYPELFKRYNKRQTKGVLLYGPPGCGKTMLAKAVATSIAKIANKAQVNTGFIYVKGPELLNRYIGNTEAAIRGLFQRARKHQKLNGYPAVLFIDEADAILGKRDGRPGIGIEGTTVPQFLAEMDGLDADGPIVLLATNRPDTLDSAVVRDRRIDRKVRISRPDQKGAEEIFKLYLKNCPLDSSLTVDSVAEHTASLLFDSRYKFYSIFDRNNQKIDFTLADLVNGAMIAGAIDKASANAMRRDIDNGGEVRGINMDDLNEAIQTIYTENRHMNHDAEVADFVEIKKLSVEHIVRAD